MADTLVVGLHSWIIQDGNYGDFATNTNAAFALEFYASSPLEVRGSISSTARASAARARREERTALKASSSC
jgi:hypothetical protein